MSICMAFLWPNIASWEVFLQLKPILLSIKSLFFRTSGYLVTSAKTKLNERMWDLTRFAQNYAETMPFHNISTPES